MKILIIDDNVVIRELISDILTVDGKTVDTAGTIQEAEKKIDSFRPDVIILDSQIGSENGLTLLGCLTPYPNVRAIILTKGKEVIPKDSVFIYDFIQKPFKSNEIMDKVRELEKELNIKHQNKERKGFSLKLFRKTEKVTDEDELPIRFGKSYVIFEDEPDSVYRFAAFFLNKGCDVTIITSGKIKTVTERYKGVGNEVKIVGLSMKSRIGYIEVSRLGTIMDHVKRFIREHDKPVIIFDNLDTLITANGLNTVMTMLYQVINDVEKTSTLVVSTDDTLFTDKDKELFLHDMELFNPQDMER